MVDLPSYISGYVDGEGCFTVSIAPRPTLTVGWEVRPSLSVSQNGDRSEVLLAIQEHFGCGTLRPDRSDKTLKWEVRSLAVISSVVIPHFVMYPLQSGKQRDFELFAEICLRMTRKEHCTVIGLREIVRLAGSVFENAMNGEAPGMVMILSQEIRIFDNRKVLQIVSPFALAAETQFFL
jgi:hypothetical protein